MRSVYYGVWFVLGLALMGCGTDDGVSSTATPAATAQTMDIALDYAGPSLGGSGGPAASAGCSEEGGCAAESVMVATVEPTGEALPLTEQVFDGIRLGIPDGYAPLSLRDEVLITAVDSATEGDYTFSVYTVDDERLAELLARFDTPDFAEGTFIEGGAWLQVDNDGAIALIERGEGTRYFVESRATREYWAYFEPTFLAMVGSIAEAN